MTLRIAAVSSLCFLLLASCARPNRVSRGTLQKLTTAGEPFVLVFGSLSTPDGALGNPVIRFVHQAGRSAPEYLLRARAISGGKRFYAVLHTPPELPFIDEFYAEVGSAETGFDKISYVRLNRGEAPLAMYVGEIRMTPARDRAAQGQTITVNIRDDFEDAARELKRLYPRFRGTITKTALLRNPAPPSAPPGRVR